MLTEIYLCHACSGQAIEDGNAPAGFFEWHAAFALLVLGWVCAPVYLHNRIATLPEYLEKRYCRGARTVLAGDQMMLPSPPFRHSLHPPPFLRVSVPPSTHLVRNR